MEVCPSGGLRECPLGCLGQWCYTVPARCARSSPCVTCDTQTVTGHTYGALSWRPSTKAVAKDNPFGMLLNLPARVPLGMPPNGGQYPGLTYNNGPPGIPGKWAQGGAHLTQRSFGDSEQVDQWWDAPLTPPVLRGCRANGPKVAVARHNAPSGIDSLWTCWGVKYLRRDRCN